MPHSFIDEIDNTLPSCSHTLQLQASCCYVLRTPKMASSLSPASSQPSAFPPAVEDLLEQLQSTAQSPQQDAHSDQGLYSFDQPQLTVFAGSGISLFKPTSLPSWWGFIKAVIAALGSVAEEGILGDAASAAAPSPVAPSPPLTSLLLSSLDSGRLPPYRVTDVLARRLGSSYLEVMSSFLDVQPNSVHQRLAQELLFGRVRAVATTNFDRALERAAEEQGGSLVRLTGDWEEDRLQLEAQWQQYEGALEQWRRISSDSSSRSSSPCAVPCAPPRPLVVAGTFSAFQSVGKVTTLLGKSSHCWIFKLHGDAGIPSSCIDTEFQRLQGLPSHVSEAMTSLLHQLPLLFLGFGGADLSRDIDYLRLRSEGDQARVHWLLREGEQEPCSIFERLRQSLGDRFTVHRGGLGGVIEPGGSPVLRERMRLWAEKAVGPVWASLVLSDLARGTGEDCQGEGEEQMQRVEMSRLAGDMLARRGLLQHPARAATATGGAAAAGAADAASEAQLDNPPALQVTELLLQLQGKAEEGGEARQLAPSSSAALTETIPSSAQQQLHVAALCAAAIACLQELSCQLTARAAIDAASPASSRGPPLPSPSLAVQAVYEAAAAVAAQRQNFPDSRNLPDAWLPQAVLAASFSAAGQEGSAAAMWRTAAAVAGLAGNETAQQLCEEEAAASEGRVMLQQAAATVRAAEAGAGAGKLTRSVSSGARPLSRAPSRGAAAPSPLLHPSPSLPLGPSSSSSSSSSAGIVYLPAFDNVGTFSQMGVSAAAMLRAHLHRAMLVGDRIAVAPHFLLNSRTFLQEVLTKKAATGGSAPVIEEAYLQHIAPLMPVRQTVDRSSKGEGRVVVELQSAERPLLLHRQECQMGNPIFLAERVDEALVQQVDAFYTSSAERRALICWYNVDAVAGTYGSWVHALADNAAETAALFVGVTGAGAGAGAAALQSLTASASSNSSSSNSAGKSNGSSSHRRASSAAVPAMAAGMVAGMPSIDAAAAAKVLPATAIFVEACTGTGVAELPPFVPAVPGLTLSRSLMYRWGDLFRYPTSSSEFTSICSKQLRVLDTAADGADTASSSPVRQALDYASKALQQADPHSLALSAPSTALCSLRSILIQRPWLYGNLLRTVSDAPYITALPLLPALSFSLLVEPGREEQIVALARLALQLTGKKASPSSVSISSPVRVLAPITLPGAQLRVTELAGLSLPAVLALRSHPAAEGFRSAVAALRKKAARASVHQQLQRMQSGEMAATEGGAAGASAAASVASQGSNNSGSSGGTRSLERSFSSSATAEETLLQNAVAAAEQLLAVVEQHLTAVDQQPLPELPLQVMASMPAHFQTLLQELRGVNSRGAEGSEKETDSGFGSSSTMPPLACCPHLSPSLWQLLSNGITVCKGNPIPPTFHIPTLAFPALVPVVREERASRLLLQELAGHHMARQQQSEGSPQDCASEKAPSSAGPASAAAAAATVTAPAAAAPATVSSAPSPGTVALASAAAFSAPSVPSPDSPTVHCLEPIVAYSDPANRWVSVRFDRVRFPSGVVGRHNIVQEFGRAVGLPGVCILPLTPDRQVLLIRQFRYPVGKWSWEVPRGGPALGRSAAEQALVELQQETGYTCRIHTRGTAAAAASPSFKDAAGPLYADSRALAAAAIASGQLLQLAGGDSPDAHKAITALAAAPAAPAAAPAAPAAAGGGAAAPALAAPSSRQTADGMIWANAGISDTKLAFFAALDVEPVSVLSRGGTAALQPDATEAIEKVQAVPVEELYEMLRSGFIRDMFTISAVGLGVMHGLLPPPTAPLALPSAAAAASSF